MSNHNKIACAIETITPKLARDYLSTQFGNRRLSRPRAQRIADDITGGRWVVNGQPFIFSDEGRLLDGQHRCSGIVKADLPIKALVVRGVPTSVFPTIDCGQARTRAHVLGIRGQRRATMLAAALRYPWLFETDLLCDQEAIRSLRPTNAEIQDLAADHPMMVWCIDECSSAPRGVLRRATFPGLYCILRERNRVFADGFFVPIIEGRMLDASSPQAALRDRMIRAADARARTRGLREVDVLGLALKCINAYAEGGKLYRLQFGRKELLPAMQIPSARATRRST